MRSKTKIKIGIIFIILLGITNFYLWRFIFNQENESDSVVEVNFFDVGQGDCALVEMPGSNQIIIDGGPSKEIISKIVAEMPIFDRAIEMMVLTHPDKDHITGLFEVFDAFEVEMVLMPNIKGESEDKKLYANFKKAAEEEGSKIVFAKQGQKISFPGGAYFLVFWPLSPKAMEDNGINDTNDFSVVGKLTFGETDFLFTGDISNKVERILFSEGLKIESDILKVAHHGSKNSSSDNFLKMVMPAAAIISVGKNRYGHPTKEVLERLEKFGIKIFRTDDKGDVKFVSNGTNINIQ